MLQAIGCSSAINGMIYIRGHRTDYDDWAALGCEGWSWNNVLPYFKRAEGNERGADDWHGGNGPLRVANQRSPRPIARAFVDACAENQVRRNDDFNGSEQEGAGLYQVIMGVTLLVIVLVAPGGVVGYLKSSGLQLLGRRTRTVPGAIERRAP